MCCISGWQHYIVWPSLMDALSPAVREGPQNSKPHSVSQIERETASNHLSDVLALSAQQGHALHAVHSVVCFHTKPWVWLLRSVSPSGRIIGCCAWSCSSFSRFMAASPTPKYLLLYISILRQQSCPMRHSKVDEKIEGTFQEVSVRMHIFESLSSGWKQERLTLHFPLTKVCYRSVFTATLLSVTADSVTYFISMPSVLLEQHYCLHSSKVVDLLSRGRATWKSVPAKIMSISQVFFCFRALHWLHFERYITTLI